MAHWHFIDLTGLKFNNLTVIRLHIGGNGIPLKWECRCDCGNVCVIHGARLRNWKAKSCGCIKRGSHNFIDLTGQKFNMLRVVSIFHRRNRKGRVMWNCVCDCGKEKVVVGDRLKNGHTKSCGCAKLKIGERRIADLTGQKFNMLTAVSIHSRKKKVKWNCKCDCGNSNIVEASNLKNGAVKSCGCLGKDNLNNITHGLSHTQLATTLDNMKGRCYRESVDCFKNYGGRGIKICDEWLNDTNTFYQWAFENGYKEGLTIERIDCNKNYCPENCTWIPKSEQSRNRRDALGIEKATEIKKYLKEGIVSMAWLAEKYKVEYSTIGKIKSGKHYAYISV